MTAPAVRPMPAASLTRVMIEGPAGAIETDINDPGGARRGIALIAHPNPLHGGTKDNKVVTTLAKVFFAFRYIAARPNLRGVGASAGSHDEGRGETEDLIAVAGHLKRQYGGLPLTLAGFSFGSYVQTRVAKRVPVESMVLVGPAVNRFPAETVPHATLVIHGERDIALLTGLLDGLEQCVPQLRTERLPEASHWVMEEYPAEVNRLIREFIAPL